MPSRRFHSKTRLGCTKCKQRRIKCDAGLPKCFNCTKRGFLCKYADLENAQVVPLSASRETFELFRKSFTPPSPLTTCPAFERIMHHYMNTVTLTVSTQPIIQQLWKSTFPSEATSRSYLWHGLLSVSLLHLMYVNQGSPALLKSQALWHHSVALSSLRKCLNAPIRENSGAVFALSMCVGLFTFALARTFPAENINPIDEILDQFSYIRGIQFVTTSGFQWLQASSFKVITHLDDTETENLPSDIQQAIDGLKAFNAASADNEAMKMDYYLALEALERRFRTTNNAYEKNPGFTMVWANVIPRGFMDLLRQKKPFALVILAHFCVLLHQVRHCWWLGNIGQESVEAIGKALSLEWQGFLTWPRSNVGKYIWPRLAHDSNGFGSGPNAAGTEFTESMNICQACKESRQQREPKFSNDG